VRALSDLRFVVAGAYVVDCFVRTPVLPAWDCEYEVRSVRTVPGGKALNQAIALARLGVRVAAVGAVGLDGNGRDILDLLSREGVDVRWMDQRPGSTSVCVCLVGDEGESSILWHIDDEMAVTPATVRAAEDAMADADAVLVTFEMPVTSIRQAIRSASEAGATVIVQPAPALPDDRAAIGLPWDGVDVVVPNESEARRLLPAGGAGEVPVEDLAEALAGQLEVPMAVVTLGADGCVMQGVGGSGVFPADEVAVVDSTGASDAFTATFAAYLAAGAGEAQAVMAGQRAAAKAIGRPGGYESMPG
jgi:ribokinase